MNMQQLNDAIEAAKKGEKGRWEWISDNRGNENADFSLMPKGVSQVENVKVIASLVGGLQKRNHFRITFKIDGKRVSKSQVFGLVQ